MKLIKFGNLTLIMNFVDDDTLSIINDYTKHNEWLSETDSEEYYKDSKSPHYHMSITDEQALSKANALKEKLKLAIQGIYDCKVADENFATIIKYRPGVGLHRHYDSDKSNDIGKNNENRTPSGHPSRDISSIVYLSDDFEGGVINFPRLNLSYQPVKGSVIIFPSSELYEHEVSKLQSGDRIMIAAFWHVLQGNIQYT